MVATYAAVTALLTAAKSREELIAASQRRAKGRAGSFIAGTSRLSAGLEGATESAMSIETELIEAAKFTHKVTGCSFKRHISTRAAIEIKRLREWIRAEGERNNTCTFDVLGEVCGYCECKRKRKPSNVEFSGTPAALSPEAPLERRVGPGEEKP